jgi:hypothetical protein
VRTTLQQQRQQALVVVRCMRLLAWRPRQCQCCRAVLWQAVASEGELE